MRALVLASLCMALGPDPSPGAWGRAGCAPVGVPAAVHADGWFADACDTGTPCWIYWAAGKMTAAYVPKTGSYQVVQNGRWVGANVPDNLPLEVRPAEQDAKKKKCQCCKDCPCKKDCLCKAKDAKPCCAGCKCKPQAEDANTMPPAAEPQIYFGVEEDKLHHDGREHFKVNGQPVTRQEFFENLAQGGQVPDDAARLRLTVIGPDADRQRVLQDLVQAPALQPWKEKLVVQDYAPTDWAVGPVGFVTSGHPTIYLQQPDGKVLLRLDQYDGPDALAEAVRKADPNYRPDQDPNGKPKPPPAPEPGPLGLPPPLVWLGAGLGLVLLARGRATA